MTQNYERTERRNPLPSLWQIGDSVSLTFPGNGLLGEAKVIKIAFTAHTEPLYDVEVPFQFYQGEYDPESPDIPSIGHVRLHGLKEWHLRNPEKPVADRYPLAVDEPVTSVKRYECPNCGYGND